MVHEIYQLSFPVRDLDASIHFYKDVLGMPGQWVNDGEFLLSAGTAQIRLRSGMDGYDLAARKLPAFGGQNFCLRAQGDPDTLAQQLRSAGGELVEDCVHVRAGAVGALHSIYLFDPDHNLVEVGIYQPSRLQMRITGLDHVVLVVESLERTLAFYQEKLGLPGKTEDGHGVVNIGVQKLNIHQGQPRYRPHVPYAAKGCVTMTLLATEEEAALCRAMEQADGQTEQHALGAWDPSGNFVKILFNTVSRI